MISHKHKFIFIHIPKTGGHSVDKYFLNKSLVDDDKWHCTSNQIMKYLGEDMWKEYQTYTIIRNPWSRMVSEYSWQGGAGKDQIPTPWGNKDATFKEFLKMAARSPKSHHDMPALREYDTWYRMQEVKDGHLNDQFSFIIDDNENVIIDTIIKFESINAGFKNMLTKIGLPPEDLPHLNKSKHMHYTEYYDQECIDIVNKRFERDIKHFNYKFGDD
jgi:hypothetical protein